jgi:predicted glycosyltransferase involved in capsule biosynthesis
MVTGSRVLMNKKLTTSLIAAKTWDFRIFKEYLLFKRFTGSINKWLAFHFKFTNANIRYYRGFKWKGIKGCNFACWKTDFKNVNGYDESFEGWGHEDADMVFRLHQAGVSRKSGSFATEVLHLYHPENNRSQAEENKSRLLQRISNAS